MNFQQFYDQTIAPFEAQYESERLEQLSQKWKWIYWLAALDVVLVGTMLFLADIDYALGAIVLIQLVLALTGAGIYQGGFSHPYKAWTLTWKKRIYTPLVDCVSEGAAVYKVSGGHTIEDLNNSCLFDMEPEKVVSGNMVEGSINGFSYRFSQIESAAAHLRAEDETEVFQGFFLDTQFPLDPKFVMVMLPKGSKPGIKLEKLDLNDSTLQRQFNVFTQDITACKRILTPELCERLLKINAITRLSVRIGFVHGQIYLAFSEIPYFSNLPVDKPLKESGLDFDFWLIGQMIGFIKNLHVELALLNDTKHGKKQ